MQSCYLSHAGGSSTNGTHNFNIRATVEMEPEALGKQVLLFDDEDAD
jgi:hypothetical protein